VLGVWSVAACALAVLARSSGVGLGGYPLRTWLVFTALAIVPTIGGHGLVNKSLRSFPAPTVGLFLLGEPVLASILAWLVFREVPGPWTLAGGAVVIAALAWSLRGARERPAHGPRPLHRRHDLDASRPGHRGGASRALRPRDRGGASRAFGGRPRLRLEDLARLPGPHVTPAWMWRLRRRSRVSSPTAPCTGS